MKKILVLAMICSIILSTPALAGTQTIEIKFGTCESAYHSNPYYDEIEEAAKSYVYGRKYLEYRYESPDEILSDFGIIETDENIKLLIELIEKCEGKI